MNNKHITFIGAGSLGSFTAYLIAKMAGGALRTAEFTIVDFDTVETHNAANQLYRESDTGKEKTAALESLLEILVPGVRVEGKPEKADQTSQLSGIVIVLVDSIEARKNIFRSCRYKADIPLYVDARSGIGGAVVYALDPRDPDCVRRYEQTLAGHDAVRAPCADQNTIPNLWHVAASIGAVLVRFSSRKLHWSEFVQITINTEGLPIIQSKVYTQ